MSFSNHSVASKKKTGDLFPLINFEIELNKKREEIRREKRANSEKYNESMQKKSSVGQIPLPASTINSIEKRNKA